MNAEQEQLGRSPQRFRYLKVTAVQGLVNECGKLCTEEFLFCLESHIANRVRAACAVHNGGRKKLDAVVAGHVGIK